MKKLVLFTLALLGSSLVPAVAQNPFDMTPESGLVVPKATPSLTTPELGTYQPAVAPSFTRHILPMRKLNLAGEEARRSVLVYLTEEQAAASASLELAYLNAVVVAPESSSLAIRVNGYELSSTSIAAATQPGTVKISIPQGVLRRGANVIDFAASQRHRTDCTIQSTYELWTDIDSASARLRFEGESASTLRHLTDLGAVGVDENGATTLRIITANLGDARARTALLGLAQQLAIAVRAPAIKFEFATAPLQEAQDGVLDVVVMPSSLLSPEIAALAPQAGAGPFAAFVQLPSKANTLVVSGPDWTSINRAGGAIMAAAPGAPARVRTDIALLNPLLEGGSEISLRDLGGETIEFNGRQLSLSYQFELPADFYAHRYGTLDIVLEAAFSQDVDPDSEIDVYTNGQIASATPLLRTDGNLLRNTVMRVPMTNLRPGRNILDLAVTLHSASDTVCSPGWTGQAPTRFVLADDTRLRIPEYARAAAVPDLALLTGLGWPYSEQTNVPVVVGDSETDMTAALLLVTRIATASDKVIPVEVVSAASLTPDQNAVIVMPLNAMPVHISGRTGISGVLTPTLNPTERALDQFAREEPEIPAWRRPAIWLADRIGLNLQDLRIRALENGPRAISSQSAALSQVRQAEGGIWTVLTAADANVLADGANRMIATNNWRAIGGSLSEIARNSDQVEVVPAGHTHLIQTQPFSAGNLRLVAANWFSGNILYFAATIILAAVLLMFATSFVLNAVGRRE